MANDDDNVTDLAGVARAGLDGAAEEEGGTGPAQGVFEGTDYTKVTFLGTNYQSLDLDPKIGDELVFLVRGRVKETGDRALASGYTEHFGKVDVSSVILQES